MNRFRLHESKQPTRYYEVGDKVYLTVKHMGLFPDMFEGLLPYGIICKVNGDHQSYNVRWNDESKMRATFTFSASAHDLVPYE